MISTAAFCDLLRNHSIDFFCGVPDSLLSPLCAYIDAKLPQSRHVIAANEGNAIALAIGKYMGDGKPGAVYMQNSGLGNSVNPLTSLADVKVYSIPMLLIIGWRGEPSVKDEPQHIKQGEITRQQLDILDIPYIIINAETNLTAISPLLELAIEQSKPVAIIVKKGTFAKFEAKQYADPGYTLKREQALSTLLEIFSPYDVIVSTTGKTSRELFELRKARNEVCADFLTVGGMGHTSSIAMGVAISAPDRRVIAIDGDGSMLMHMGALPIIGGYGNTNLIHILLNNQCHESVGGQATVAGQMDIEKIALGCGYKHYMMANSTTDIIDKWTVLSEKSGPIMFEIKIAKGARVELGRPSSTPIENRIQFMHHLGSM